jgi:hypothetical protein
LLNAGAREYVDVRRLLESGNERGMHGAVEKRIRGAILDVSGDNPRACHIVMPRREHPREREGEQNGEPDGGAGNSVGASRSLPEPFNR